MKKQNLKPLILSALGAVAMAGVGTGATFALFTDKAETTVSAQAGKVEVSSGVTIEKAYSLNALDATSATSGTHASYVNGGQADVSAETGNVQIQKWTPGDGIKLRTAPVNGSNVNILTRFKISLAGDLAPALEIRVREAGASDTDNTNVLFGRIGAGQLVSDWVSLAYSETPNNPTAYDIDIVFPDHDNGEIKFGADNKDNQYMDKTATVVITYEAVQGNADVGANLLDRLNATLATESIKDGGYNETMFEAMADIAEANLADEAAVKAAGYVWNPETDQFYDFSSAPADAYKYFKIADNKLAAGDYSIYASSAWNVSEVSVSGVGFDVGSHTSDIASVSYTGLGETNARTNFIRTNSLDTDVIVEAPYDTVYHYGDAHTVTIHDVANHSYHEFGRVALMDVAKGRVALEAGSDVKNLHFSASKQTENDKTFDNIVVAYDESLNALPTFSRDAVDIAPEGTLVVELQNSVDEQKADSDYVWLFQQGLKEQIRITEEVPTEQVAQKVAEAPKSTDNGVAQKTSVAAKQIANNLSGNATYKTYAELQEAGAINADGSVKNEVLAAQDAVIVNVGVEQTAEAKQAALEEIVEEAISVIAGEESGEHVARIKSAFYDTFTDAFDAAKSGDTIRVLAGNNINADNTYDVTGKNIIINVEKGATLAFGSVTNNKFTIGWLNTAGRLEFEGEGKITFDKDNNYGLVGATGAIGSSRVTFRDLTVEASTSNALLSAGIPVYIESGHFKNIAANGNTHISGGLFNYDVCNNNSIGLASGKMCVNDSGDENYPWIVRDLDAAHANFSVNKNSNLSYYNNIIEACKAAGVGDTVTFIGQANIVSVNYSSSDTRWVVTNGSVIDLNNHTVQATGERAFSSYSSGSTTVTIKNGTIGTSALTSMFTDNDVTVVAEDLQISEAYRNSALPRLSEEGKYFVKNSADCFTIATAAPAEYAAKIVRANDKWGEYYYTSENGVKEAMADVVSGDIVYVNRYEADAKATLTSLEDTLRIIRSDDSFELPEVVCSVGKTIPATNGTITDYTCEPKMICNISGVAKGDRNDFVAALQEMETLGGNRTITLLDDVFLTTYNKVGNATDAHKGQNNIAIASGTAKTWTIDLNGHKIYGNAPSGYAVLKFVGVKNFNKVSVIITDSSQNKTGGIVNNGGGRCLEFKAQSSYASMVINAGIFDATANGGEDFAMSLNSNQNVTVNGGAFYSNNESYGGFYNSNTPTSITGGVFRSDFFWTSSGVAATSHKGASAGHYPDPENLNDWEYFYYQ